MTEEREYDQAFADTLAASAPFRHWLLKGSRFAQHATTARLLEREQHSARRNARQWWKHWWSFTPDGGSSETDIFAVFEAADGSRFALHIEDKPPHGILTMSQALSYRTRAAHWAAKAKYLDYQDFETILLAPAEIIARYDECARKFDRCLRYEDVAHWIPLFANSR